MNKHSVKSVLFSLLLLTLAASLVSGALADVYFRTDGDLKESEKGGSVNCNTTDILVPGMDIEFSSDFVGDTDAYDIVQGYSVYINGQLYNYYAQKILDCRVPFQVWHSTMIDEKMVYANVVVKTKVGNAYYDYYLTVKEDEVRPLCDEHILEFNSASIKNAVWAPCTDDPEKHYLSSCSGNYRCTVCGMETARFTFAFTEEKSPVKEAHTFRDGRCTANGCGAEEPAEVIPVTVEFTEISRENGKLSVKWSCEPEADHFVFAARYLDEEDQLVNKRQTGKEIEVDEAEELRALQIWVGAFNRDDVLLGQVKTVLNNRYAYDLTGLETQRERMETLMEVFAEDTFNTDSVPEEWKSDKTCWNNWVYFSDWKKFFENYTGGYDETKGFKITRTMYSTDGKVIAQNPENEEYKGESLLTDITTKDQAHNSNGFVFPEDFAYEVINLSWTDSSGKSKTHTIVTERRDITYMSNGKETTFTTAVSNTECPADGTDDSTHHSVLNGDFNLNQCTCGFFSGAGQCLGFGKMIYTMANGKLPADTTNVLTSEEADKNYQYGDYVRSSGHSYIILEGEADQTFTNSAGKYETRKGVIVFDANRAGGSCAISYTHSNRRIVTNLKKTDWYRYDE